MKIGDEPSPGFDNPLGLLRDCHRRIERFLGVLRVVADADALDEPLREALRRSLDYFRESARRHTEDEEVSLFPRLRRHTDDPMLARLESDHAEAETAHARIDDLGRRLLDEGVLDESGQRELRRLVDWLEMCYDAHIKLEDDALFPLAARVLPTDEMAAVGYEMAARRGLSPRPSWLDALRDEEP